MKKMLNMLLIVLPALAVLGVTGLLLFRHFVTDQIADWGGMENPDTVGEEEQALDGEHTYAANEVLLSKIVGSWKSADDRWGMTISEDYGIAVTLDNETVLEDMLEYTYLQPGEVLYTELGLQSGAGILRRTDGSRGDEIILIHHEAVEGDIHGKICMELADEKADREMIEFRQYSIK